MGQKSSCCTYQDQPLQTEIDSKQTKQSGIITVRESKVGVVESDSNALNLNRGLSLFAADRGNKVAPTQLSAAESAQSLELRKKKLKEILQTAPLLELKVISSSVLPKGHKFTLNAQGVYNSFRNQKDGFTYFGCKKRIESKKKVGLNAEIVNDCIIPNTNPEMSERHRGRHFEISFDIPTNSYKLRDLGVGFGCFYKLDFPVTVKDNYLFSFGTIFMLINFQESSVTQNSKPTLILKFYGGQCNGEIRILEPSLKHSVVGRHSDCDIQLNDNLISKYQCHLQYSDKTGWTLHDGFENRPSTNGTWLYVGEPQTIYSGMIFKANQTLFQANII